MSFESPHLVQMAQEMARIKHKDELTIEWDITLPAKSVDEVLENKYHDLKEKVKFTCLMRKVPVNVLKKIQ